MHHLKTFTTSFAQGVHETPRGFFAPLRAFWRLARQALLRITRG